MDPLRSPDSWLRFLLMLGALALAWPAHAQTLRVGLYENEPKLFTSPHGEASGIFPDLLRAVAAQEGWTLQFVRCEWSDCLAQLERGELDLMPDVAQTDERLRRFAFHQTPALQSWSQLYRRPGLTVNTVLDVQGLRIAVLRDSVQESTLRAMLSGFGIQAELVPVASFAQAFQTVADGRADLAAVNHFFGSYQSGWYGLVITPIMWNPSKLFIAAPKGRHAAVLETIDRRLRAWQADDRSPYFQALRRWIGPRAEAVLPDWVPKALAGAASLGVGLGVAVVWLRRRVRRAVADLEAAHHNLRATLQAIPDTLCEIDAEGRCTAVHAMSPGAEAVLGLQWTGRFVQDLLPPDTALVLLGAVRQALEEGVSHGCVLAVQTPTGPRWFELSVARKASDTGTPTALVLARNITDRRNAEVRVHHVSRLYAALGQANEAVIRAAHADRMIAGVCEAAVAVGGLALAWVGWIDRSTQTVRPQAWYGPGREALRHLVLPLQAQDPSQPADPVANALQTGVPCWCQDYLADPPLAPWYAVAQAHGWRSLAAIPLRRGDGVEGVLVLYAQAINAFDDQTQVLLLRMARALEYGLEKLARDEERRHLVVELRRSEQRYRRITESIRDVIWTLDPQTMRFTYVSPSVERLRGYTPQEVMAQPFDAALPPDVASELRVHVQRDLSDFRAGRLRPEDVVIRELPQPRKDGSLVWTEVVVNYVEDPLTGAVEIHGVTRDISERKAAQARIEQLAHFDQLTGLPNRTQLNQLLEKHLALAQRNAHALAVVFVDLDHFKTINDSLGHEAGDQLLVQVAQRLLGVCRSSDIPSRMGGDEFVVILTETDAAGATHFAQRLIEAMRAPVHVAHSEISVGLSIGVALFPDDGTEADVLLRKADGAMYQAKAAGRNDFRFFTPDLQARSDRLLALSTALARAVELEQMAVHYQPLVSLRSGRVIAAEALLRWHHPELGDVSPAEFVPVAENTGRILELGRWVLSTAARHASDWHMPGDELTVAVNISAVQFRHRDFVETVRGVLQREGLPAQRLELELTESIPMGEPAAAAAILERLAELSVRVSIDDFGAGYSSLGYLKKLGFYKLKIDRSFVIDIGRDPDDEAIIRAIVQLAQTLGMQTLAEGVETWEQARFLAQAGCDHLQGWLVSPAVPADAFEAFVAAHDPRAFLERLGGPPPGDAGPR